MKRLWMLLGLLVASQVYSDEDNTWRAMKYKSFFSLSADIDIKQGDAPAGHVVRTGGLCPRYHYDLYNAQNVFQARGVTRAFSLGFLFSWGMQIDVCDPAGSAIGMIQGQMFTRARAKFYFYNAQGQTTGIAYLNNKTPDFMIVSPNDESLVLAELHGKTYGDLGAWEMKLLEGFDQIDESLLKIFSAFAADYQADFEEPPKVVNQYYFNSNNYNFN